MTLDLATMAIPETPDRAWCEAMDRADPLAPMRGQFVLPDGIIYLDGNSLGAMPRAASARAQAVVTHEWGADLIKSWNSAGWFDLPERLGDKLAPLLGHGLQAIVEISLDRQGAEALDAFEQRVAADDAVQQCYRVSPGPDFVLVVQARDMPDYLALAQRLFTSDANVRNVKAYFSVKRSKFGARVPLPTRL